MKHLKNFATKLYPDKKNFFFLAENHPFVPIVAELPLEKNKSSIGIFMDLFYRYKHSFLLDSGKGQKNISRYSFLGGNPFLTFNYHNHVATIWKDGQTTSDRTDPIKSLSKILEEYKTSYFSYIPHFFGGGVGYFSYDIVCYLDAFPSPKNDDLLFPDINFIFLDDLVVIDHFENKVKFICLANTNKNRIDQVYTNSIRQLVDRINQYLLLPCKEENLSFRKTIKDKKTFKSNVTKQEFEDMVRQAKKYIKDGDIYQVNLSRQFNMEFKDNPMTLFQYLRKINPSPFSAFLKFDDTFIVCSSPERLVKVYKNSIETRPIAGTRPRGKTINQDKFFSHELLLNKKEKAEHLMLVDLERNDLGRICEYGTVEVDELMILEKYSHVWHIVSNISGRLKNNIKLKELLTACFPGGTITGCPKIRSAEIIHELEHISRGPYTGSLGYIGFSGEVDLNIIIRTILIKNNTAFLQVGAGIVADSDPEQEFYETYKKAEAMLIALQYVKNPPVKTTFKTKY